MGTAVAGVRPATPTDGSATSPAPALEAEDLYRFYRAGEEEARALRGVSLTVRGGELVAVTGPSGSGKSTLLACLAGLEEPSGGTVRVAGRRISHRPESERAVLRAELVGVLWQTGNLVEHLDVADNVALARALHRGRRLARPRPGRSVEDLLAAVGLGARARSLPSQLSGGELARAGLAVALANGPRVLLADEPTGELDSATESTVLALLRDLADDGVAVLVVTHSATVARAADRRIVLADGKEVAA